MSNTTYKLLCLVEGENAPFSIVAPSTMSIGLLQQMVKKERSGPSGIFRRVDASQLDLWKVCYTIVKFQVTIDIISGLCWPITSAG
jgi:hypothetical protein